MKDTRYGFDGTERTISGRSAAYRSPEGKASADAGSFHNITLTVVERGTAPREISLDSFGKTELSFGRLPDNDIQISSVAVSSHHGRFRWEDGSIIVTDQRSKNGILYQSEYVTECRVMDGDVLRIDARRGRSEIGVMLLFNTGSRSSVWKTLPPGREGRVLIGRSSDCSVILSNPMVSRHHAEIVREGGRTVIRDLDSMNGTFVNGQRLNGRAVLVDREVIQIANTIFIYSGGELFFHSFLSGIGIRASHLVRRVRVRDRNRIFGTKEVL